MIDRGGWVNIAGKNYFVDEYARAAGKPFISAVGGSDWFLPLKCERDFRDAFNQCPPLKAIVSKRAKTFNTGKRVIRYIESKQPVRGNNEIKKLISRPNILQNEKQFFAQQNHYVDIYGYCPVLFVEPSGFEGTGSYSSIWNIPPWLFDIEYTRKWLLQASIEGIYKEYWMNWDGDRIKLNLNNVRFILDDGIGTEDDTNLTIPDSRLVGMDYVISNLIATYKSRNTLITKRGAIGILSNESQDATGTVAMLPGQKEDLQRDFAKYGLLGQPYQIIITDATLKWQQMGFPTKDLMLFEEETADIERLCDAYYWPVELIARGKDVTFDNKFQARKDLYTNVIIPEADSRMEQFSRILFGDESTIEIACDYSEVPVLQEDLKTKAEARKAVNDYCQMEYDAGLMTKNQWLEELGRPPVDDPEFDKYKEVSNGRQEEENQTGEEGQNEGEQELPGPGERQN